MATGRSKTPDFFNEDGLDPVDIATKHPQDPPEDRTNAPSAIAKKKAGFYLSVNLLNRFNQKFHELKLAGVAIDNKSTLLESALGFALDDMDKGLDSQVLQKLGK